MTAPERDERRRVRGVCYGYRETCPACLGFSDRVFGPSCGLCRSKGSILVMVVLPERSRS